MSDVVGRVEDDYRSCLQSGSPFGVVVLEVFGLGRLAAARPDVQPAVWRGLLGLLRRSRHGEQLHAFLRGDAIVVGLPGVSVDKVEDLCREILTAGRKLAVGGLSTPVSGRLCLGMAGSQAGSDLLFQTLILVAQRGAAVAGNRGGGCFVHTKLYELMQGRAERAQRDETPDEAPDETRAVRERQFVIVPSAAVRRPAVAARPERPEPPAKRSTETRIRAELERVIERDSQQGAAGKDLDGRLQGMVDGMTAEALAVARREYEERDRSRLAELDDLRGHQTELDRLERRISKLTMALEETERRLADAAASNVDAGVSSAYRSVQGLPPSERDYDLKLTLLQDIVDANLELRELIRASPDYA